MNSARRFGRFETKRAYVQDKQKDAVAEAEVATDRLQKSLDAAKSIVRDYKRKLARKPGSSPQQTSAFNFRR